jgi:hypothetical protein
MIRVFFDACHRHGWLAGLAPGATIYAEELPFHHDEIARFIPHGRRSRFGGQVAEQCGVHDACQASGGMIARRPLRREMKRQASRPRCDEGIATCWLACPDQMGTPGLQRTLTDRPAGVQPALTPVVLIAGKT